LLTETKGKHPKHHLKVSMDNTIQANEIILIISIGIGFMLLLAFAFILFFNFSQKKLQDEKLKMQQLQIEQQQKLLYSNILTQEEERKRIAKDLHDEVGSKLNVLFLNLHRLKKLTPPQSMDSEEVVQELFGVINDTINTTRRISHDLLPPTLENFGLKEAIKELCESYQKTESVDLVYHLSELATRPVDKMVDLNLFRILQELIKNSITHGEAKQIIINLRLSSNDITIEYSDNGKGFDLNDPLHQNGLGMQNIESRLRMIKGKYDIESEIGKGVKIKIEAPQPDKN